MGTSPGYDYRRRALESKYFSITQLWCPVKEKRVEIWEITPCTELSRAFGALQQFLCSLVFTPNILGPLFSLYLNSALKFGESLKGFENILAKEMRKFSNRFSHNSFWRWNFFRNYCSKVQCCGCDLYLD